MSSVSSGEVRIRNSLALLALVVALGVPACRRGSLRVDPSRMEAVGTVDVRYQSYNVEMVEVTGGRFWKPYASGDTAGRPSAAPGGSDPPSETNPDRYAYRAPLDLTNPRLRKLAAALGPAYVRVSGTWANSTYFADSASDTAPPAGFKGLLSHRQWAGVVDFARAVDASIVTSFATSAGARDATGVWSPDVARRWVDFTRSVGGKLAAVEFMNEPTLADIGEAPPGYDAVDYGRDFKVFLAFAKQNLPGTLVLGPSSSGESDDRWRVHYASPTMLKTVDLLRSAGPGVDAFSYHHYGALSKRCAPSFQTTPAEALSEKWLSSTDATLSFYRRARDESEPGKPLWLTETADAACGGNPWASTFLDPFRYLDQLGRLAKEHVQVVAHNTLAASDYGLLDERDLTPRPNYWAALLWRKFMGTTVLEAGVPVRTGLHVYAHCLRGAAGGVALLVINTDKSRSSVLTVPIDGERYTLSSADLQSKSVQLNGTTLALGVGDELPALEGVPVRAGDVVFRPTTMTFLAVPKAANAACRAS